MRLQSVLCKDHYRLLVVGGGTGGCAVAAKFARLLPRSEVALVEPSEKHYYQPGLTLVGAGILKLSDLVRPEQQVLPKGVEWLKSSVGALNPARSELTLTDGRQVAYDFLVLACGLELRFDLIEGLPEGFASPGVCSIYDPRYASKVHEELKRFSGGTAVFTMPNAPIKCAGAPQKICYLAEEYIRKAGRRADSQVTYCTPMSKIFGVDKYANALMDVVRERDIQLRLRHNLTAVDVSQRVATFELLDESAKPTGATEQLEYSLLHVAPPCSPVKALRDAAAGQSALVDAVGWVDVDAQTLQCRAYSNVFALGDCSTLTTRTAAAVSSQLGALGANLQAAMAGKEPTAKFDGYTSCPLVVDSRRVILAEFNAAGPLESFPWNQARPLRIHYLMKRYLMPFLYWRLLLKGRWHGPAAIRRATRLFKRKEQ